MQIPLFSLLFRACIAICIIILISCAPIFFTQPNTSYWLQLQQVLYDLLHPGLLTFSTQSWIKEPFLFTVANDMGISGYNVKQQPSTPLFPYVWQHYITSMTRYLAALLIGFQISSYLSRIWINAAKHTKIAVYIFKWIPFSFTVASMQCGVIFIFLKLNSLLFIPHSASIIIIFCTALIPIMATCKEWIPFIHQTKRSLRAATAAQDLFMYWLHTRKTILFPAYLTMAFLEPLLNTNGLITFMLHYWSTSPSATAAALLLLYFSYFFFVIVPISIQSARQQRLLQTNQNVHL